MANGKNSVIRVILGVLSFCISFFFAMCVLVASINFANPLLKTTDGASDYSAGILTGEIIAFCIFIGLTVWSFWGGLRLVKAPKKKKEKVELLGEEF